MRARPRSVEIDVSAMGGNAHVILVEPSRGAAELVRRRLAELEAAWSRFLPDSDISRLNRAGGGSTWVRADTVRLVEAAVAAWRDTEEAFDPTVHDALVSLGYDRTFLAGPGDGDRDYRGGAVPGCDGIEIDASAGTVRLPPGVGLDPGGIGKGLAADLLTAELIEDGCSGACVNLAGDLRVRGDAPTSAGWVVSVDDPMDHRRSLTSFRIDDGGVATSATNLRRWGAGRHHLVDPATGLPAATDLLAVTVIAPECAGAEASAKQVLIRGVAASESAIASRGAMALGIREDGTVVASLGWPDAIRPRSREAADLEQGSCTEVPAAT